MKAILLASLFLFSGMVYAKAVPVRTSQVAPFNCGHAEERVQEDLIEQCKAIDLVLKDFTYSSCFKSGDDGGYVEYFTLEASGTCDDEEALPQ
jgi:hypothetical protein